MKKYDLVIFIGRFQPFHNEHLAIAEKALEYGESLLFCIGSAYQPCTYKNPFRTNEIVANNDGPTVEDLITRTMNDREYGDLFDFVAVEDALTDNEWVESVQEEVKKYIDKNYIGSEKDLSIALIGCNKDETTYYLDMFPQWDSIEIPRIVNLSATMIRELYFVEEPNMDFVRGVVPSSVYKQLLQHKNSDWQKYVLGDRRFVEKYKSQFATLPYPPVFVTTDAVVFQSGHVLVVRRKPHPGKGLLALPGGFLDAGKDKSLENAMIRELREETGLKVPDPVLRGNIKEVKVVDTIDRSARGRTITHVYKIVLPNGKLPRVKGGNDPDGGTDKAFWLPFSELKSWEFFEDHYRIIKNFI